MSRDGNDDKFSANDISGSQMALVAQLARSVATMHHVDELFQWLAYAMVQHFNLQMIQFWTNQISNTGGLAVQLRTVVRRDSTLPEQVIVNDQMAYIAQRVTSERRSYQPQLTETLFPPYQATLLKRYGLNYCGICFTRNSLLLPPPESIFSNERSPVPLAMTSLFFVRQFPHSDTISTFSLILEQAMIMAGNRNLLLPMNTPPPPSAAVELQATPPPLPRETVFPLEQLIPQRRQDADLLLTDNPFARTAIISDKKARRLHAAIDGHTNVAALCHATGMNIKEVYVALQMLLSQHRIDLYKPDGQPASIPPTTK